MAGLATSGSIELSGIILRVKGKVVKFETAPLLSARDIKEMLVYKLMTEEQMQERIFNRHLRRQQDINVEFTKQFNLSK